LSAGAKEPRVTDIGYLFRASGGVVPPTLSVVKDVRMGEFNKDQSQQDQTGEQGGKPAFGQFDKEQGQQGQQEFGQKGEELETEGEQQGDNQIRSEKGQGGDQDR
jgi:hypothetical protein